MGDRGCQVNMAQPVTPHLGRNDLYTALFTDYAPVLHPLVLTAVAFKILHRTKYLRAEEAVSLRLEGPVVNGLRFFHFAMRPRPDLFRRGDSKPDGIKVHRSLLLFKK